MIVRMSSNNNAITIIKNMINGVFHYNGNFFIEHWRVTREL